MITRKVSGSRGYRMITQQQCQDNGWNRRWISRDLHLVPTTLRSKCISEISWEKIQQKGVRWGILDLLGAQRLSVFAPNLAQTISRQWIKRTRTFHRRLSISVFSSYSEYFWLQLPAVMKTINYIRVRNSNIINFLGSISVTFLIPWQNTGQKQPKKRKV